MEPEPEPLTAAPAHVDDLVRNGADIVDDGAGFANLIGVFNAGARHHSAGGPEATICGSGGSRVRETSHHHSRKPARVKVAAPSASRSG